MRLALVTALALFSLAPGCGGGSASPESVVRAWSEAINSDDNEAAADLFARGAEVIQAGSLVLRTEEEARRFNAGLPCSGEIVDLVADGDSVTATFRLGDRRTSRCDAPGAEARAEFRVRDGKIVLWHQLPSPRGEGSEPI